MNLIHAEMLPFSSYVHMIPRLHGSEFFQFVAAHIFREKNAVGGYQAS